MATIKSFTSLEQSKKLADILPLESADMRIGNYVGKSGKVDGTNIHYFPKGESFGAPEIIDAWSLAALLSVLPFPVLYMEMLGGMILWSCECHFMETDEVVKMEHYDNPVDACVTMIEKLKELNLL